MPAYSDLIHEISTSVGTGNLVLTTVTGKRSFNTGFGLGGISLFDYFVSHRTANEWERGTGHMLNATTLVRDAVLASSNANAAVNFSPGIMDVTNDQPAGMRVDKSYVDTADSSKVGKAGGAVDGAMTGDLYIAKSAPTINLNDTAGSVGQINYSRSGVSRWIIRLNSDAEGGANTGSSLLLLPRDDAGAALASALTLDRATRNAAFGGAVAIGTNLAGANFRITKDIGGATSSYAAYINGVVQSDVTSGAYGTYSSVGTEALAFTCPLIFHNMVTQGTFGAGSIVTSQYGYYVSATLVGATNNYGFYSNIPSGTNRWNLYCIGTAPNYMAGSLGIGTTGVTDRNLGISKSITGGIGAYGIVINGPVQSDVTSIATLYHTTGATAAATFTLGSFNHFQATQGTFGAGSIVTNQTGFSVASNLIGATNNRAFVGDIPAGTNRWNTYNSGSARNYMLGALSVGATDDPGTGGLHVEGPSTLTGAVTAATSITLATPTGASNLFLNPTTAAQQALLYFRQTSVNKWAIGKQTDDSFAIYDSVAAANILSAPSNGTTVSLLRATEFSRASGYDETVVTFAATTIWPCDTAPVGTLALTGNTTMGAPTGVVAGRVYTIRIVQNAASTVAWTAANFKFAGGAVPVITTVASAVDRFTFIGRASNVLEELGRSQEIRNP